MTLATCSPFLLTSNPMTPFLSLILPLAGSLHLRVMKEVERRLTRKPCGGPVGTEVIWTKEWGAVMGHSLFSDRVSVTGVTAKGMSLNKLSMYYLAMGLNNNYCKKFLCLD